MYKTNSEKSKIVLIFKVLVECRFNFIREKYLLIASYLARIYLILFLPFSVSRY